MATDKAFDAVDGLGKEMFLRKVAAFVSVVDTLNLIMVAKEPDGESSAFAKSVTNVCSTFRDDFSKSMGEEVPKEILQKRFSKLKESCKALYSQWTLGKTSSIA